MSQYTPHTPEETGAMLKSLGLDTLGGLFSDIPETVGRGLPGGARPGLSQLETLRAMEALAERGCRLPATVVASHVLLAGNAAERLAAQPIAQVVCTNSIRGHETRALALLRVDISGLLADAISRIHGGA